MYLSKESLYGNIKSKFILIKDSKDNSGLKLFKTILNLFFKESAKLHVVCYDGLIKDIASGLKIDQNKIDFVDAFSDCFGWSNSEKVLSNFMSPDLLKEKFLSYKGVVFIWSITPLLIQNDVDKVYKLLHKLLKENDCLQFVVLMHSDVHSYIENDLFEKLASTNITMPVDDENYLSYTVRYASGKVCSHLAEYKISDQYEFSLLHDINTLQKHVVVKQPDPTANLTFNLRLRDNEKEARSQLQLPYMKKQTDDNTVTPSSLEDDYYEEEDPDDDLDI